MARKHLRSITVELVLPQNERKASRALRAISKVAEEFGVRIEQRRLPAHMTPDETKQLRAEVLGPFDRRRARGLGNRS